MELDFTTLEQLKVIFTAEQFIITGSLVANILGISRNEPKDIDIMLLNPTKECIDKLKEFEEKFPKKSKGNYPTDKLFQIRYNGTNFDIFITSEKYDEYLNYRGFIISPVDKIVSTKKSYKSPKHILQLMKWRNQIISNDEIEKLTNNL